MSGARRRKGFEIDDPERIRLLGSPIRNDIVALLDGAGPIPVAEIAAGVGRPADTLYYHVDRLEEAGLVVRREPEGGEAIEFDVPARPFTLRYRPDDPDNAEAIADAIEITLRSVARNVREALATGTARTAGASRNVWASRGRVRLTDDRLREVNAAIGRVLEIFREARGSETGRMHEVTIVLDPLPEEPADRRKA